METLYRFRNAGQSLTRDNLIGALAMYTGDCKFLVHKFDMAEWWKISAICFKCRSMSNTFNSLCLSDPHFLNRITDLQFKAHRLCEVKNMPGMHIDIINFEWMHTGPLGCVLHACGATM